MAQLILNNNSAAQFICYEKAILFNDEFGSRHIFFTKVAKRYCSNVVGIALAAYDWVNCMNLV